MMLKLLVTMALMSAVSGAGSRSDNAVTCEQNEDLSCKVGFSLKNNVCTACVLPTAAVCGNSKEPKTAAMVCAQGNANAYTTETDGNGNQCMLCPDGKFAAPGDGCTKCSTNAETCNSATEDTKCNEGFYMSGAMTCKACVLPDAAVCGNGKEPKTAAMVCAQGNANAYTTETDGDGNQCMLCPDGKFDVAAPGVGCTKCSTNAETCNSATVDTKCKEGFYLKANTCTACVLPTAAVCGNGKEPNTAAVVCEAGTNNYETETNANGNQCIVCAAGKFDVAAPGVGCTACGLVKDDTSGANPAFHGLLAFAGAAIAASLIVV